VILDDLHFFPGFCLLVVGLGLQYRLVRRLSESYRRQGLVLAAIAVSTVLLSLGYFLEFNQVSRHLPAWWATWLQCASIVETMSLIGVSIALPFLHRTRERAPQFQIARRNFLQTTGASLCLAPVAATAFGIVTRNRFQVSEVHIPVPNLPKDLDGLKIVQLSDIHLSAFLSERELARAIDMANETRSQIALVTGDLITRHGDPLDACLGQLARLRADAGVLGCLGNHEIYTESEGYVTAQGRGLGIEFLRHEARGLRFGGAAINVAGVDYQRKHFPYLKGAEKLVAPGSLNILLSHNPDVFPVAAAQGFDVTIAGHTHGGQIDFELLHQHMNAARYFTPYVRGLYREGKSFVYVSSGLGTIGVPVRIGAPPEISLLRLCAT
jgi:predicted MPP superfamily phosphohydrolase